MRSTNLQTKDVNDYCVKVLVQMNKEVNENYI